MLSVALIWPASKRHSIDSNGTVVAQLKHWTIDSLHRMTKSTKSLNTKDKSEEEEEETSNEIYQWILILCVNFLRNEIPLEFQLSIMMSQFYENENKFIECKEFKL